MGNAIEITNALSDEIRLRITLLLWEKSLSVKCLVDALKTPQPTVSRHLKILLNSGLLTSRRQGGLTYYSLNFDDDASGLKKTIISAFHDTTLSHGTYTIDNKRLMDVAEKCGDECVIPSTGKDMKKFG